eukprot:TRINITY_DN1629_c0_g1_i2.p1 TRINITY_DN1629_c0_g1~~TRINITY_DN1629_c0_g1_i2.p1  ORF type:complete len:210 (-),score=68.24 TRINITY_DN1629_c0_g1_i2:243-872(-)
MADIVQERIELPNAADKRKVAFMLHNVFTPEECKELIRHSEAMEYKPALVNIGGGQQRLMPDVRNNERVIEDTEERSEWMYQRIREYVPQSWRGRPVVGLNERLRYLRYDPGQKFEPHMDGTYMRTHGPKRGEASFVTVQIYLNEGFEGGTTRFLHNSDESVFADAVPRTGSVLIFQHDILHQGSELIRGRKYTIRTDVMYGKTQIVPS